MRLKTHDAIRMQGHFVGTLNASPVTVEGASGRRTFAPGELVVRDIPMARCAEDQGTWEWRSFIVRPASLRERQFLAKSEWPIEAELVWEPL